MTTELQYTEQKYTGLDIFQSVTYPLYKVNLSSGQTQVLSFDVQRGAFTQDIASAKAYDMVLTFNFN